MVPVALVDLAVLKGLVDLVDLVDLADLAVLKGLVDLAVLAVLNGLVDLAVLAVLKGLVDLADHPQSVKSPPWPQQSESATVRPTKIQTRYKVGRSPPRVRKL